MDNIMYIGGAILLGVIVIITLLMIITKLYKRASKSVAFVRTGSGGSKVIKDGGTLVLPVLHEIVPVNMNTMKLDVSRKQKEALITLDRMRVDVGVEFYVRVEPESASIETAAQTLGDKTTKPEELKKLVEGKFVDALRSVASAMTMKDLHEKRADFVQKVQQAVESDLKKNGLELEAVSLTSFDQTDRDFFNPDNAFDAEGLTRLTQEIEQRKKDRNDITRDNQLLIAQKDLATEREQLNVNQSLETARFETAKQISLQRATQDAEIARFNAEKTRDADTSRIEAEKITEQARLAKVRDLQNAEIENELSVQAKSIEKDLALKNARIEQEKEIELAEQNKRISVAKKSEEEAAARASAENARAKQVEATQQVTTVEQVAEAERRQKIELINADANARKESIKLTVSAEAEAQAAEKYALATLTKAKAEAEADEIRAVGTKARYEAEAEGQAKLNEAANTQSPEIIRLTLQTKLIEKLPEIIRESVKPMEKIDSIRIVDMGNSNLGMGASNSESSDGSNNSLPDQIVSASLRHRAAAPLLNELLSSVGLESNATNSVSGMLNLKSDTNQGGSVKPNAKTDTTKR